MNTNKVIDILFNTPDVVNVSQKDDIEVQPGVFSSIYVNLKAPLAIPISRKNLANLISKEVDLKTEYICGVESGGSYYASAVADFTSKKIILFRKNRKEYNITNFFVGKIPQQGDLVTIVDDVMSSGNTIARAVEELQKLGCTVRIVVLFSYCWDHKIAENMGVEIVALSNAYELIEYGLATNVMTDYNAQMIRDYIAREEFRLYKKEGNKSLPGKDIYA